MPNRYTPLCCYVSFSSMITRQCKEESCQPWNKFRIGPSFNEGRVRARFRATVVVRVRVRTRVGPRCGLETPCSSLKKSMGLCFTSKDKVWKVCLGMSYLLF